MSMTAEPPGIAMEKASMHASRIYAFEVILVLVIAAEYWNRLIKNWHVVDAFLVGSAAAVTLLGILVLLRRARRLAFAGIALVIVSFLTIIFPAGGNHEILGLILCLLCAALDTGDSNEGALLVDAVRWLTCVILFWAGVQKLAHGFYVGGEYLAYSVSRETYASVFSWLLPAGDLARLAAYDGSPGTGPYRTTDALFLLVSNASWILEIALAPLLLWRPTRRAAVLGVLLLLVAIESAAREMFFFFVLLNMLLLFLESDLNRRLIGAIALALGGMLLVRLGVLPEVIFS